MNSRFSLYRLIFCSHYGMYCWTLLSPAFYIPSLFTLYSLSFHFTFPLFSLYNPSLYFTLSGIRTQDLKLQVECYTNVRYSACAVSAHRYSACALASSRARADDLTRDRAEARITRAHSCRYCKRECHKERVVSSITYLYS